MKAKVLVQLSDKYTRYATVYACLVMLGAILLGWNAAATVYALAGLIVVLPAYGVAHLMRAFASLLPDSDTPRRVP